MSQNKYLVQLEKPERPKKRVFGLILEPADDIIGDVAPQDIVSKLCIHEGTFGKIPKLTAQSVKINRLILAADNSSLVTKALHTYTLKTA